MSDTSINRFLAQGDDAAEAAFTPSPPTPASGPDPLQLFLNTEATPELKYWDGANFTPVTGGGTGTVTNTGTLTDHALMVGNGGADISALASLGTTTTVLHGNAAGDPSFAAVTGSDMSNATVTLAKIANAAANDKLVGSGNSGSGASYVELSIGSGLTMTGTTLSAAGSGGDVTAVGTLTADTVILGDGTTDVKSLANGSDGDVLTLVSGAPAWASGGGGGDFSLIEEKTPSGTGTITFSSLGSFTHLELRWQGRTTESAPATAMGLQFNGDTIAHYYSQAMYGNLTTATAFESLSATTGLAGNMAGGTADSNMAGDGVIRITNYRGTTFFKTWTSDNGYVTATTTGNAARLCFSGLWASTTAITSITLLLTSGNYVAGSKFTLYGLT